MESSVPTSPTTPTSPSPSSSSVPIIRPGKSILKKPPPPQRSFFSLSTLSKLLPTAPPGSVNPNGTANEAKDAPLKRAHFILPQLSTVYPISSANPPHTPNIKEEKRNIELREAERRRQIVRSNSFGPVEKEEDEWWSMDKVETFYAECCASREEPAHPTVLKALRHASTTSPRSLDLSGMTLTPDSAAALSDILTIEWGLRKLVLRECDLIDKTLKPILHSLLITNTLLFLSIASNRNMKTSAFKLIGIYISKSKSIQYLDISQNALEKKAVEYIVAALGSAPPQTPGSPPASPRSEQHPEGAHPPSSLLSLRMDDCSLRPASLEVLAHAVRTSPLRNISLRHNRINATGAVALALMIKDYPDSVPSSFAPTAATPSPPASPGFPPASPSSPYHHHPAAVPNLTTPTPTPAPTPRAGPIAPPPRHPVAVAQAAPPQTTYTPYIPKARRAAAARAAAAAAHPPVPARTSTNALPFGENVPVITSSAQGGVTTRHPPPSSHQHARTTPGQMRVFEQGPSVALLDKVRALDNLPRLGALRTLDLRGNDIRGGVSYIAQVLKRNRTLKLLNLSENKIDVAGLVQLAEALKYNSCLETLDLSKNPCCGPGLEGIQSLRTAFTLNSSLKRLFLSSTGLTSAGAIALAEFLPESTSLLHLDLTLNPLVDHAGVLALSVGLKANFVMRCLDLNIPPGNEEMARLCREILSCCIRNTEEAEKSARAAGSDEPSGKGAGKGVWSMIESSELAKSVNNSTELKSDTEILVQARECKLQLEGILARTASASSTSLSSSSTTITLTESEVHTTERTRSLLPSLVALIENTPDPTVMEEMLELNDALTSLLGAVLPPSPGEEKGLQGLPPSLNGIRPPLSRKGSRSSTNSLGLENGHAGDAPIPPVADAEDRIEKDEEAHGGDDDDDDDDEELVSPRVDKGKGRAQEQPSPVLEKLIMAGAFSITDSDDEDEERRRQAEEELLVLQGVDVNERPPLVSPTERSRVWVEEEGEIFRKGQALLSEEQMESEYAGEELRQGLLVTELERPPPRHLEAEQEDYFDENLGVRTEEPESSEPLKSPATPTSPVARPPYAVRQRSMSTESMRSLSQASVGPS